jgi:hypothetical protein
VGDAGSQEVSHELLGVVHAAVDCQKYAATSCGGSVLTKAPSAGETHDLTIVTSEDAAFANSLLLDRGEGKSLTGPVSSFRVRQTVRLRRSNDRWLITHEHISFPFDLMSFAKSYLLSLLRHAGRWDKKLIRPASSAQAGS